MNSMNFPSFRENSNEPEKSFEIKSEEDHIPNIYKSQLKYLFPNYTLLIVVLNNIHVSNNTLVNTPCNIKETFLKSKIQLHIMW